jgi:hypothetical protein
MFPFIASHRERDLVDGQLRNAQRRPSDIEIAHRIQRERVRKSLLLRPSSPASERRGD